MPRLVTQLHRDVTGTLASVEHAMDEIEAIQERHKNPEVQDAYNKIKMAYHDLLMVAKKNHFEPSSGYEVLDVK